MDAAYDGAASADLRREIAFELLHAPTQSRCRIAVEQDPVDAEGLGRCPCAA
jgi:hypothetical protein